MAAELHLAENTLALHLLLQHLERLVDIVIADENLHAAFLFVRADDGSTARALGPLARGFESVPADGRRGCQLEETEASVGRRFWGSSSKQCLAAEPSRDLSAGVFAQQEPERGFARPVGFRHRLEINLGMVNRAGSAGAINLPAPRFRWRRPVLYDNGKVFMIDHRTRRYHTIPYEWREIADLGK
jgi:hypothetical protein